MRRDEIDSRLEEATAIACDSVTREFLWPAMDGDESLVLTFDMSPLQVHASDLPSTKTAQDFMEPFTRVDDIGAIGT